MSAKNNDKTMAHIVAQAMNVIVQREFMEHTRTLREKERQATSDLFERGVMSRHISGEDILSETYRLALQFNSLSDYEEALSELEDAHSDFDRQAEETYNIISSLDDEDPEAATAMDELMAEMLSPVDSLSRYDVLQRLACVYAVLLAEWEKLGDFGVSDLAHRIKQDAKLADHLSQAFGVMHDAATLDYWNVALSQDKSPVSDDVLPALKDLQP